MHNMWVIARNTLGDSIRKRVLLVFLGLAIVMLGLALLLRYFTVPDRSALFTSTQLVIILIFGGLISITTAVFLIPSEIENRTVYSVLSKPVRRTEFFLGKFLGGTLTVTVMVGIMALALLVALIIFSALPSPGGPIALAAEEPAKKLPWITQTGYQALAVLIGSTAILYQLIVVTAIATTLSLFLTATVNFSVTTFLWILGSLQWIISALANRNEQGLFLVPWLLKLGYYLVPHFDDINFIAGIRNFEVPIQMNTLLFAGGITLYHLIYGAIVLLVGVMAFDKKEF